MKIYTPSERRLPIGAEVMADGRVHFRVWAPKCGRVQVVVPPPAGMNAVAKLFDLEAEKEGYFSGFVPNLRPATLYGLRLDDREELLPDPASRFQPQGPEGLSEIVDSRGFPWSDGDWRGVGSQGQVIYEMHIGTFTREGTWAAAMSELGELSRAGMTIVEVMPVADFVGEFGWGYDGVCLFAPTRLYGRPDDFRKFVDQAHVQRLGVILDVVYNHFGTIGNSIPKFSDDFRSRRYSNEWGDAINFDDVNSGSVREFFLANVRYWIEEFHLDGIRFDATQAIHDSSTEHILSCLVAAAREAAGSRSIFLVAENEPQDVRTIRPQAEGGHGLDAAWNDDFHHTAKVRLTGHNEAYLSDYLGAPAELLAALKTGFLYQGQLSQWQSKPRGTPTTGIPATGFVNFLQNHDQIANSGLGERIGQLTSPGRLRAMTALWLLAPQTPMFFQGQEFAASSPFLYFADNSPEQAKAVREGRAKFLSQFPTLKTPEAQALLNDPADRASFERCKLDFQERESHRQTYALHLDLLRLRREDPVFSRQRSDQLEGAVLGPDCLCIRVFGDAGQDRLLLVNFARDLQLTPISQPLFAPPAAMMWRLLWSSNDARYGACGTPPLESRNGWRIPGEATVVLEAVPHTNQEPLPDAELHSQAK